MSSSAKGGRLLLIVVSAPSGAGKTTLCDMALAASEDIVYSVSCTTRAPRGREVDGEDYVFLSPAEFDRRVAAGEFLEHAEVHGAKYGTLRSTVEQAFHAGRSVLMDIDVQGAAQIRRRLADLPADSPLKRGFVDIFIAPPSLDALRARLEGRAEDAPDVIARRLLNAEKEMESAALYRYRVVNGELDAAFRELMAVIDAERQRE